VGVHKILAHEYYLSDVTICQWMWLWVQPKVPEVVLPCSSCVSIRDSASLTSITC